MAVIIPLRLILLSICFCMCFVSCSPLQIRPVGMDEGWAFEGSAQGVKGDAFHYSVKLIDIDFEDCGVLLGITGSVQVTAKETTTVVPGIRAALEPQFLSPRNLFLLSHRSCEISSAWLYDMESREIKQVVLPDDLDRYFGPPSLSPQGDKIAYQVFNRDGQAAYSIRSWPSLRLLKESRMCPISGGDTPWLRPTWLSNDAVKFDTDGLVEDRDIKEWKRVAIVNE